jgi:hypothetical protein
MKDNDIMLLVNCEIVGRVTLVWPSDLIGMANTSAGIVVRYRCVCGREAEMLTGARVPVARAVHLESAA